MNFSVWSIKNPIPSILLFILLSCVGLYSFYKMEIQSFPDIELPVVTVTATLPGAAPRQLETDVATKIEDAIYTLEGLKHQSTIISDGVVTTTVEFDLEKNLQEAVDDVRGAISRIQADLPAEMPTPAINKINVASSPILTYTIQAPEMDEVSLSWFVDHEVQRRLLQVHGVGAVSRVGGLTRQINIEPQLDQLTAIHMTVEDLSKQLKLTQLEASGGQMKLGQGEQVIRIDATAKTVADLSKINIALKNGNYIRLDQLANITDSYTERRSLALLDGQPVIGFEILRSKGASEIEVEKNIQLVLQQLQTQYPDLKLNEAFNFVNPVKSNYNGSMYLLYEGALLAILVVWLFLRDWRATLIAAIALPLSILPAFAGMYYLGFTINVVTLLALSLVVGILVDDAIVEIENIIRHMKNGQSPYQAAMNAVNEIGLAVIATTLSLIVVFLPTAFMSGVAGKFFVQFGWTASLAIFTSLLIARLLTPMMCAYLLKSFIQLNSDQQAKQDEVLKPKHNHGMVMDTYLNKVKWCVEHKWLTLIMAIVLFMTSMLLIPLLKKGFIPSSDTGQTQVRLELPAATNLKTMVDVAEYARKLIQQQTDIKSVYTTIGAGSVGNNPLASNLAEVRKAVLTIQLVDYQDRQKTLQQIEQDLRKTLIDHLSGTRVQIGLETANNSYQFALSGEDADKLLQTAYILEEQLRSIPNIGTVTSGVALERKEIVVKPDYAKAAMMGISPSTIAQTIRVATIGDYDQNLSKLNSDQRQIPIVMRLPVEVRQDIEKIKKLMINGQRGEVMLGSIAAMTMENGYSQIERFNRLRNINFIMELNGEALGDIATQVTSLPIMQNLPEGVVLTNTGDAEVMVELFSSFGLVIITGVVCIYAILILLFRDFFQPVTILMALLLSTAGAFILLLITNNLLALPSLIGLIMLMGIAAKNSILLVDYIIIARTQLQLTRAEAIQDACLKRARPIIMTSVAMGAGMLPIALGFGTDPSFRMPMAIAIIGGLVSSTLLSLLVIPAVYVIVDNFKNYFKSLVNRKNN
ncbi:efflux RND transporter permease subunit [Acinetobacter qingfengensis]|uniref:RND transporter n=1 Tax=Acinetobacter qingfengensis TaxID=1262585 RepID=A0A1E7R870_9GAMM|nr:efflux RND transporter permease subunit [Acinetobacter qingfengensis]KAA8734707.1 efflux RND transporter permease subunit [Acinetobacter qingfengensis]OEY95528.1 RND transporter [Acinetobacter qingfengensis]